MSVQDSQLGIQLITLRDLLGDEPSEAALDGVTIQRCREKARCEKFEDTGKVKDCVYTSMISIKFWVILDCGERREHRRKPDWTMRGLYGEVSPYRNDRYLPVAVGAGQDIHEVELEENGVALPGQYASFDEACEASSDLCAVCRVHEE